MKKIKKWDDLPKKIKFVVGGGIKNVDRALKHFADITIYECTNKKEIYEIMKKESLEPMTMIDKDPLQGRSYFVALGLPYRKTIKDLIYFNNMEYTDTVLYFAEMNSSEVREALKDERKARQYYRDKQKSLKGINNGS